MKKFSSKKYGKNKTAYRTPSRVKNDDKNKKRNSELFIRFGSFRQKSKR